MIALQWENVLAVTVLVTWPVCYNLSHGVLLHHKYTKGIYD